MKHLTTSIIILAVVFLVLIPQAVSDVVKLTKVIPTKGTVRWAASSTQGAIVTYKLLLDAQTLWQFEYREDEKAGIRNIDPFRHSQLIDIQFTNNSCSFLLSGYEGIHFFLLEQIGGVWKEKLNASLNGISASPTNPLKEIALADFNTVKTVSPSGAIETYSIQLNGVVTRSPQALVNVISNANTISITVPAKTTNSTPGSKK